jgi:hypothetical protein
MTVPGIADLKRNQVKAFGEHTLVPPWKESAAEYGRGFTATKVFGGLRHPSGYLPGISWFAGEPAKSVSGMASSLDPGMIWVSAELKSWEEIVETAAHETVHTYDYTAKEHYHDHELPTLVGKLAAAHWAGEREVFVKWGPLSDTWLPEGESEVRRNAVVLHFKDGDHHTLINTGQGSRPRWEPRALCL